MKTELNVMSADVVAGKKIDVVEHNIRNFRLHLALQHVAMMQLGFIENDSGNMNATVIPRNVKDAWMQLALVEKELEFAKTHNDPPLADHEEAYKILLLKGNEIQRISNIKQKRVIMELDRFAHIAMSVDSAKSQGNISDRDFEKIYTQLNTVKDAMSIWLGQGSDNSDTGISVPDYSHLGEIVPSVDLDYSQTLEPSKDLPLPHLPDTPDV